MQSTGSSCYSCIVEFTSTAIASLLSSFQNHTVCPSFCEPVTTWIMLNGFSRNSVSGVLIVRQITETFKFSCKVKQSRYTPWRRLGGEEV
jgi:hypothetical protein